MRYWGILVAKIAVALALLYAIWVLMAASYVPPAHLKRFGLSPFLHDLKWTTMVFLYFLFLQGLIFLIVLDQRYRCRTCARRLRMPVNTGRMGQFLLFGKPQTEYICVYGHGTLTVPQLHISGVDPNKWEPHDDIWKELYALHDSTKE